MNLTVLGIIAAALLALVVGVGVYERHQGHAGGYAEGTVDGDKRAARAEAKQHAAEANVATLTASLEQVNAARAKADREADEALARAQEAVATADQIQRQADRDAAAFAHQLQAAAATPACRGLKENLCATVPFPY